MADTTITSANSIFTLSASSIFPTAFRLVGYMTDNAFTTEANAMGEVQMGVDGRMTAGRVITPVSQVITLQADSPSKTQFAALIGAMQTFREIFYLTGTIELPSTGEVYALTRGILVNAKLIPDAQRLLSPVTYNITWESVTRSLL